MPFKTTMLSTVAATTLTATCFAGDFAPANAPEAMGRLVPEGAWGVVYIPSFNHMLQEIMTISSKVDPAASQGLMMAPFLFQQLATIGEAQDGRPAPPASFHMDKPMAVAFGPTNHEVGMPAMSIIMSADNAAKVIPAPYGMLGGMDVTHLPGSNYVCFSNAGHAAGADSHDLMDHLFGADISIAIDQEAVVAAYETEIHQMLQMMDDMSKMAAQQGNMSKDVAEAMARVQTMQMEQVEMLLHSFSEWSIGIDFDGTDLDLLAQYELGEQAPFQRSTPGDAEAMRALAQRVPGDYPVQFVMGKSTIESTMQMSLESTAEAYPPQVAQAMAAMMPLWEKCIDDIDNGIAGAVAFDDKTGFKCVQAADVRNGRAAIANAKAAINAIGDADWGIDTAPLPARGGGFGVKITLQMAKLMDAFGVASLMDMAKAQGEDPMAQMDQFMKVLFGGDSIDAHYMVNGNLITSAVGNDPSVLSTASHLAGHGHANPALEGALAEAYAGPTWAVSMDMSAVVQQVYPGILAAAGPARVMMPPKLPDTGEVVIDMVGSANDHAEQVRLQTDLADWITWVKAMEQMAATPYGGV